LAGIGAAKMLDIALYVRPPRNPLVLTGTGLVVCNPTFGLEEALGSLLPFLADRLAIAPGGGYRLEWLSPESSSDRRTPPQK
jgi:23S rRNA (adenine2030-N6)-methyltransferase